MKTEEALAYIKSDELYIFPENSNIFYIKSETYHKLVKCLRLLRKRNVISVEETYSLIDIFKTYRDNEVKYREAKRKESRYVAQTFIGKPNIRKFIFKRDKYKCLKCNSKDNLSIDHILPISKGDENKISNLQTLCSRCNSYKSTKYIDYR